MIVFYNMNRLVIDQATRNGSMPYYFGAGHLNLALMMDLVIGVVVVLRVVVMTLLVKVKKKRGG